jgi:YidC/Oxa1 family membrane protein insertase
MIYTRLFPPPPQSPAVTGPTNAPVQAAAPIQTAPATPPAAVDMMADAPALTSPPPKPAAPPAPRAPEQIEILRNDKMALTFSSYGAGIVSAELLNYRQSTTEKSPPVLLNFSNSPALIYNGVLEIDGNTDFEMQYDPATPDVIRFEKTSAAGWKFIRTYTLVENYQVDVVDVFTNAGTAPLALPEHEIQLGYMSGIASASRAGEYLYLGVDALQSVGGEGVVYWAKKIPKIFSAAKSSDSPYLPASINQYQPEPVDWVAAKNKFFVQLLVPARENTGSAYRVLAQRKLIPGEQQNPALSPRKAEIAAVSSAMVFPSMTIRPGDSLEFRLRYYAGPKKFSILRLLGMKQEEVMEFGMWSPVCKFLLKVLNTTYKLIPNYGVAIIILTILIRILFWPLTHKSTESMKKMQALQPLMMEIREKYKDNPQKMQTETMELYRKHKVNPMGGCLPMLIQIPVFIALFVVLRSAIELRFAEFLWIKDLSEPERLLADILPIPLNILPIIMAVTMAWQQKLTPTADSSQQRMMMVFMPVMMLVMFYMMPSALVLYWTTNQCIMIAQQLVNKKRTALKAAGTAA